MRVSAPVIMTGTVHRLLELAQGQTLIPAFWGIQNGLGHCYGEVRGVE